MRVGNDSAGALRVNGVLTELDLSYNEVGDAGAEALAGRVRYGPTQKAHTHSFDYAGSSI